MKSKFSRGTTWIAGLLIVAFFAPLAAHARPPQQDFLTQTEAEQIRNAGSADARIGLFLDFGADRLRRFEHELQMKNTGPLRADFLNDLLDSFSSCVDEASGRVDDAISHGEDVRGGIRDIRKSVPQFLEELKKIKAKGLDLKLYEDTLNDTISDLQDDLHDAEKAEKQLQSGSPNSPVRGRGGR
jgi:hypothetical protein